MLGFGGGNYTRAFGDSWRSPGQVGDLCEFHASFPESCLSLSPDFI